MPYNSLKRILIFFLLFLPNFWAKTAGPDLKTKMGFCLVVRRFYPPYTLSGPTTKNTTFLCVSSLNGTRKTYKIGLRRRRGSTPRLDLKLLTSFVMYLLLYAPLVVEGLYRSIPINLSSKETSRPLLLACADRSTGPSCLGSPAKTIWPKAYYNYK